MNVFAYLGLVDLIEVGMVCLTAIAIVGILARAARRRRKGCGCEFCYADEHKEHVDKVDKKEA